MKQTHIGSTHTISFVRKYSDFAIRMNRVCRNIPYSGLEVFKILTLMISVMVPVTMMGASLNERVFSTIDTRSGLSDNQVLHILQVPDGRMVISTLGNINIYDATGFDYVHYDSDTRYPLPDYKGYQHVYVSKYDFLWSKSWGNVQCFSLRSNSYVSNIDSLLVARNADRFPLDLFVDQYGYLWTVSQKGILDTYYNRHYHLLPSRLQDLETKGDTAMLFYDTGVMEGFDRRSGKRLWHTAAYTDTTSYSATSLVRVAPDGTVLQVRVGDNGESVLLRFDSGSLEWTEVLKTPYVLHTLAVASSDEAYVASQKGLWHINLKTLETDLIKQLSGIRSDISLAEGFNTLFIDRDGGCWVGTYNEGLLYSSPDKAHILSRPNLKSLGVDSLSIKTVNLGEEGTLEDKEGRIWTATRDGLKLYDPHFRRDTVLYVEDGLSNNFIKSIAAAADGTIWVSTANGVNAIHINSINDICIDAYDSENGALPGEYFESSSYLTSDGWPLFPHPLGWTLVNPTTDTINKIAPTPLVRKIIVNGEPINFISGEVIDLGYDQNDIAIDFASLNFAHPGSTVWQYRICKKNSLQNDTVWTTYHATSGNGGFHMTLPHQTPGEYRLQVRSSLGSGMPFGQPVELLIQIHRPWWLSGWALACYIFLLLALCSGGWSIYRNVEKRRIEKRHSEEKMLLRMTELIERCNYYEEKIKAQAEEAPAVTHSKEEVEQGDPSETAYEKMSKEEKDFISRAINLVEINMNKGYSVEKLSSDLCMERTGLYKRLTALLDKSPSAFIRSIRLNHVARLLEESNFSMNEIAEMTGFSSSSHMSRCFKEERGCTPSEYVRRMESKTETSGSVPGVS